MDEVFGALSDSTRRIIVEELANRDGQSLFEICGRLAMRHGIGSSRQTVTRHLDVLESAGMVRVERSGRSRLHFLKRGSLDAVRTWITMHSDPEGKEDV